MLPADRDRKPTRPARPERTQSAGGPGRHSAAGDAREPSLRDLQQTLLEGRWVIATVLLVSVCAAAGYLFITPPTYRASALLQIVPRPEAGRRLEDLSALFEPGATAAGESELMRSRLVLGAALDRVGMDVRVRPHWFPVLGQGVARFRAASSPQDPPLGFLRLARFAWGGERISVRWLSVPEALLDHRLTLTALGDGRYRLAAEDGSTLLEGQAGAEASATVPAGTVAMLVGELSARTGTEFEVEKLSRPVLLADALHRLTVGERGAGTGIIAATFDAPVPGEASSFLSALCAAYLQEDAEKAERQAGQTLDFLNTQLPDLRTRLDRAETALIRYREKEGTIDLPLEAKAAVDRTVELDRLLDELAVTRAQLVHKYTEQHPDVRLIDQQIAAAQAEREALASRKVTIPQMQLGAERLKRSVEMAADLYLSLEKKAQELAVVRSGRTSSSRVIDWPLAPYRPVRPIPGLVMGLGILLGLCGGIAAALGRRAMDHNAEDPRDIEHGTGLPVYVTIPHSPREVSLQRSAGRGRRVPLALVAPDDAATEMLRTLRTALSFVLKARGKIVALSSPSAGVGKSFVCANLAQLIAAAGQRVLLVDADLRQGRLHRYFSAEQSAGLSDVLSGEATLDEAIKSTGTAGLEILPRGEPAFAPAELLARPKLAEILATAAGRYDVVLVDTPPILAVTDALLVARSASVNLLVLRARQHPLPEIADALELYARSGLAVHGGILNDSRPGGAYARAYPHRTTSPMEVARVAG
ncbi:MAG TPA: polysaccharide biosynthesis tyrosine autokinase [Anaeromyxobacter sp.]|nr:polysaccharide biosynthesis tyrosine autokinase [Anaeromyxobacter sp.]